MSRPLAPKSPYKETNQIIEYAQSKGFTFEDIDASGHYCWFDPLGEPWKHSSTPSVKSGWVQHRRREINDRLGIKPAKYNRQKAREREAKQRETDRIETARETEHYKELVALAGQKRADELLQARIQKQVHQRHSELVSTHYLMTSTGSRPGQRPRF